MCRRSTPKPRPKSCIVPHFKTDPKLRFRPTSYREPDTSQHAENMNDYSREIQEYNCPQPHSAFHIPKESLGRLDTVIEEADQTINGRNSSYIKAAGGGEQLGILQVHRRGSELTNQQPDTVQTHLQLQEVGWLTSNICSQEVKIGLRKDVFPDSVQPSYSEGTGDVGSNRGFSTPECQILHVQDYQTTALASRHSPDLYTPSDPCGRPASPENHHWVASPLYHAGTFDRALSHRGILNIDPALCVVTRSDSPGKHSGKVFLQTHL